MEVRVCKNCKRLFQYIYGPELCPECTKLVSKEKAEPVNKSLTSALRPMVKEEEEKFEQVKDYIMAHPKATIVQIAEANEITPTKLFEWIREDRLEFSEESKYAWFVCEKCGTKIKSGRFCNHCKGR
ncbi:flagellar protein [Anaerocolumna sedimenticola]|uniref:Flagellar protein n=1 Tax=Anaerocolumna sedimenticola TaxID=2696063 RepID=A0A6P1TIF4_9FIRM|nr:flagellar protein [Anaerocolumna sedimenticola]QHQ60213.1 flagellar protein [Anaerocolumna sedimenticola]